MAATLILDGEETPVIVTVPSSALLVTSYGGAAVAGTVMSDQITRITRLSQAEYDALPSPEDTVMYVIVD